MHSNIDRKVSLSPVYTFLVMVSIIGMTIYSAWLFNAEQERFGAIIDQEMTEIDKLMYTNINIRLNQHQSMVFILKSILESSSSAVQLKKDTSQSILQQTVSGLIEKNVDIHSINIESHIGYTLSAWDNTQHTFSEKFCTADCHYADFGNHELGLHVYLGDNFFLYSQPVESLRHDKIWIVYSIPKTPFKEFLNSTLQYSVLTEMKDGGEEFIKQRLSVNQTDPKLAFGKIVYHDTRSNTEILSSIFYLDRIKNYPRVYIYTQQELVSNRFYDSLFNRFLVAFLLLVITISFFIFLIKRKQAQIDDYTQAQIRLLNKDEALQKQRATFSLINTVPFGIIFIKEDYRIHLITAPIKGVLRVNNALKLNEDQLEEDSFIIDMLQNNITEKEVLLHEENGNQLFYMFELIDLTQRRFAQENAIADISNIRYVLTATNITNEIILRREKDAQINRQDNELKEMYEKEREDNKSKTVFLTTVSHEMRTPLNGIKGAIELINTSSLSNNERRYFDMIRSSSSNLLRLVNDVLDFTKIQSGKLEFVDKRFDLIDSLEKVSNSLSITKHSNVNILIENIGVRYSTVLGDPLRFEQVIINLLSNALKFTTLGYIKISLVKLGHSPETISYQVNITDTGVGIPKAKQQTIFQRFTQATADVQHTHGGTGLGLAISKSLCYLMGGDLTLDSEARNGSTFSATFTFKRPFTSSVNSYSAKKLYQPYYKGTDFDFMLRKRFLQYGFEIHNECTGSEDGTFFINYKDNRVVDISNMPKPVVIFSKVPINVINGDAHIINSPALSLRDVTNALDGFSDTRYNSDSKDDVFDYDFHSLKVLVVDDNETNRIVIKGFLESINCVVMEAEDGEIAIDKTHSFQPSLILMDLQMPKKNGIEATKYIRANFPELDLPIVALTAAVMAGDRENCMKAGMNGFLTKPIEPDVLIETLSGLFPCTQKNVSKEIPIVNEAMPVIKALNSSDTPTSNSVVETNEVLNIWNEEAFRKRLNNSDNLISKVLQSFLNRSTSRLTELDMSYQDSPESVRRASHAFKGMAKEIAADRLAKHLLDIELKAGKGVTEESDLHIINEEVDILVKQLPYLEKK